MFDVPYAQEPVRGVAGAEPGPGGSREPSGVSVEGVTRRAAPIKRVIGRGPVPYDSRKFGYDRNRGLAHGSPVAFGASRADRLDADVAGRLLHRIHTMYGIENEGEEVLVAFDKALFFEHAINGASMMQSGDGYFRVADNQYDVAMVKKLLGTQQRKFFRAFADEVADVNREVLDLFDPFDLDSAEKHGQLMQVAVTRGLQKFPHLAHDSSDAGLRLSVEERVALQVAKRVVLPSDHENTVDRAIADVAGTSGPVSQKQQRK